MIIHACRRCLGGKGHGTIVDGWTPCEDCHGTGVEHDRVRLLLKRAVDDRWWSEEVKVQSFAVSAGVDPTVLQGCIDVARDALAVTGDQEAAAACLGSAGLSDVCARALLGLLVDWPMQVQVQL